jgi:CBS domain-containing protein
VVNARNQLVGMLSRLDVLRQISGAVSVPESAAAVRGAVRTVGEVMRSDLPVIHLHEGIDRIVEKFAASA